MASKEEIKSLFVAELKNSVIYQEVLLLKQAIIAEIASPNVNMYMSYSFSRMLEDSEIKIFQMCCKLEFGFIPTDINNLMIIIDMSNFV